MKQRQKPESNKNQATSLSKPSTYFISVVLRARSLVYSSVLPLKEFRMDCLVLV